MKAIFIDDTKPYNHLIPIPSTLIQSKSGAGRQMKFRCVCGEITIKKIREVVSGKIKSCGCKQITYRDSHVNWSGFKKISGAYWGRLQASAKLRGIDFDLTIDEAWSQFEKQNGKCALTGELLVFATSGKQKDGTASLDRINSSKGYVKNNIQWLHKDINTMKMDHTTEQFLTLCKKVVEYNKI